MVIYDPDAEQLAFNIEFPNHEVAGPEYMANLRAFLDKKRTALPPVDALGLVSNPPTAAPSRPRTPRQRLILLDDEVLGRGIFGEVRRVIHARDGGYYATKRFNKPLESETRDKKRKREDENWLCKIRNEVDIMRENPHVSVTPS